MLKSLFNCGASTVLGGGLPFWAILLAALGLYGAGVATGWTINGWRLGEQIAAEDAAENKALAAQTDKVRQQERTITDTTQQLEVDHATRKKGIDAYAAENARLRRDLVRLRFDQRGGAQPVPGQTTDPSQCAGQPAPGHVLLPREDYELLLDFSGDLASEADGINELYRVCRDWAYQVGRAR